VLLSYVIRCYYITVHVITYYIILLVFKCEFRIREAQTRGFIGFKEKRVLSYDVFLTKKHITQHEKMYHNRFLPSNTSLG